MALKEIRKRDGKISPFNKEKVTDAIFKAASAVGGTDRATAEKLSDNVMTLLEREFTKYRIPSVEDVQDAVEKVLIEDGHAKTAKAYILYRQERTKVREEARKILGGRFTTMYKQLSLNALRVLAGRYLMRDLDGHVMESPEEMIDRVAKTLSDVETAHGKNEEEIKKLYKDFKDVMINLEFLPAGRTLANAGASTRLVSNCIVLHMEDSMAGIFETLKNAAQLQQAGSGLGFPFHLLRPAGSSAVRSRGVASGPVSFLRVYDKAFGVIKQQGRHGANMAVMKVTHPDILEYIHCKSKEGDIKNFNISVAVPDDFMEKLVALCKRKGFRAFVV
jgi:ribonucleoside-diphosphate reductase alpha chain